MNGTAIDYLTPKVQTYFIAAGSTIRQALEVFDYHKFSVVSVIDSKGRFVSTISEGDILRYIKNVANFDMAKAESIKIEKVERYRPYKALGINSSFDEIVKLSLDQNYIPVVDDRNVYIGIIRRSSIINAVFKEEIEK